VKKLLPHQLRAAEFFLQGLSVKEVAKRVGRSIESVQNWQADPLFKNYLEELHRDCIQATLSEAVSLTPKALRTLKEIMNDPKAKATDRIKAANSIMQHGMNARHIQEMKSEIERLKQISRIKHVPALSIHETGPATAENGAGSDTNGFAGHQEVEAGPRQRNGPGENEAGPVASGRTSEHIETDLDELQPPEW